MEKTNLIRCKDLSKQDTEQILRLAGDFKRGTIKVPLFFGSASSPSLALMFLENSTRTKLSFELAAKNLGYKTLEFAASTSSLSKGESLADSLKCLEAMGVSACVIRSKELIAEELSARVNMKIISAGEGTVSHPSQALLDYFTWSQYCSDFSGKKLLIVGDVAHSRVASSHFEMAKLFGVEIMLAGPRDWIPQNNISEKIDFDEGIKKCDAIMMLRVQRERHKSSESPAADYNLEYGLNAKRIKLLSKDALIFHPGPFNLGMEITGEVLEDSRCKIWEQVENGVFTRQAILHFLIGENSGT